MKTKFTLALLILVKLITAQAYQYNWTKKFGGNMGLVLAVTNDINGNIYATGRFGNPGADFDPGPLTVSLTSNGGTNCFISKFNANGDLLWAKRLEAGIAVGRNIKSDVFGNVLVSGFFSGTADFDPSPGVSQLVATTSNSVSGFLLKLNMAGDFLWVRKLDDINNAYGVLPLFDTDKFGEIIFGGDFEGTADFDLGLNVISVNTWGLKDGFISKLDAQGDFIWVSHFGGDSSFNYVTMFKTDNQNNHYVVGKFSGVTDFNPAAAVYTLNSQAGDTYVSKFSSSGNFMWAKQLGSQGLELKEEQLMVDDANNIYFAGTYSGTCDFNPGAGTHTLNALSKTPFLCKLDSSGNFDWVYSITTPSGLFQVNINSVIGDNEGSCYLTGNFNAAPSFNFGNVTSTLSLANGINYICKVDHQGNLKWLGQFGGQNLADGVTNSINIDKQYNIYFAGDFFKMDFNPGSESDTISCLTSTFLPQNRMFISKLSQPLLAGLTNSIHQQGIVNVFPNPSRDKFNLQIQGLSGKLHIKLYNLFAEVLQDYEVNETELVLDASYYEKGVYILEVLNTNHLVTRRKVVKN